MVAGAAILIIALLLMMNSGSRIKKDNDIIRKAKHGEASEHSPNEAGAWLALFVMLVLVFIAVTMGLGGSLGPGQ